MNVLRVFNYSNAATIATLCCDIKFGGHAEKLNVKDASPIA